MAEAAGSGGVTNEPGNSGNARGGMRTVPLLLLPGHVCDYAVWEGVVPRLAGLADCRIPEFADETSLPDMAERVLAVAPETFALAGHSMGGRVALEVLRTAPHRIERLALLDTGCRAFPAGPDGDDERARRVAFRTLAREKGMPALAAAVLARMVLPSRLGDAALVDAIRAMVARQPPERVARQGDALLGRRDASDAIRTYAGPLVVICGAEDRVSLPAQNEELVTLARHGTFVVIPACGHMTPMERPADVAAALAGWLRVPAAQVANAFAPAA
jgi:pimeloyl-ACP methyl ester carboxylesterase